MENLQKYLQNTSKIFGIILIIIGIILIILITFNKVNIDNNRNGIKDFLKLFNENIRQMISKIFFHVIAIIFIIVGIVLLIT
jgi:type II secretory pathway component PulF